MKLNPLFKKKKQPDPVEKLLEFFVIHFNQIQKTSVISTMTFYDEEKSNNNPPQHASPS